MTITMTSAKLLKTAEFVLLLAIFGLLLWSKPWAQASSVELRKITVTGEATIEAKPDKYLFTPYYEVSGTDQEKVKAELTQKTNESVAKLEELGVAKDDIKLDINSYDQWFVDEKGQGVSMAYFQISVDDSDLAQKVQDYLTNAGTVVKGSLTPQATFSDDKETELETQATDKAIEDAKRKAEQQAKLLGAKVGKVIEVKASDADMDYPVAFSSDVSAREGSAGSTESSVALLPGQNEYAKTIVVTYELQ
jgi:uncharacterized protein YggE